MNRLWRIIILTMLVISLWGVARNQTKIVDLRTLIYETTNENSEAINSHLDLTKDLAQDVLALYETLNLSVLKSCGIITDGFGHGSCVAIRSDLILTAGHCVDLSDTWIEIGGNKYTIKNKWRSDKYDVGFVEIEGEVPFVEMGLMPDLLQTVYLVGAPYSTSFENSITKGIVSKLNVDWQTWSGMIQTDSEGAPGSSGCPLFCERGGLIGICVSGPQSGGGVSLCVPITHIQEALEVYETSIFERGC